MTPDDVPGGAGMLEEEALLRGLIHEVRHPLTGIRAGLQLLAAALGDQVRGRDEWDLVLGQVARIEELLQGYQDLMRSGEGPREFVVGPVLRRALDVLGQRLQPMGARFTLELPAGQMSARGSPRALHHAVLNLVANGLDAVERAGAAGRLALRARVRPGSPAVLSVRVSDEGPGIPPELRARVFEAGFTTKAGGAGSGLGLYVARRMISASGGSVALVDDADQERLPWARTEVRVELPLVEVRP